MPLSHQSHFFSDSPLDSEKDAFLCWELFPLREERVPSILIPSPGTDTCMLWGGAISSGGGAARDPGRDAKNFSQPSNKTEQRRHPQVPCEVEVKTFSTDVLEARYQDQHNNRWFYLPRLVWVSHSGWLLDVHFSGVYASRLGMENKERQSNLWLWFMIREPVPGPAEPKEWLWRQSVAGHPHDHGHFYPQWPVMRYVALFYSLRDLQVPSSMEPLEKEDGERHGLCLSECATSAAGRTDVPVAQPWWQPHRTTVRNEEVHKKLFSAYFLHELHVKYICHTHTHRYIHTLH